jgi:hypothetical protein
MVISDTSKPISCWRRNTRVEIGVYGLFLAKYGNLECDGHLRLSVMCHTFLKPTYCMSGA